MKTYRIPPPSCQSLVYSAPLCFHPRLHQQSSPTFHLQYYPEPGGGGNEEFTIKNNRVKMFFGLGLLHYGKPIKHANREGRAVLK